MTFKKFSKIVLKQCLMDHWKIEWTAPPSECVSESKTIFLSNHLKNDLDIYKAEMLLHEIAHAKFSEAHDADFYKGLGHLFKLFNHDIVKLKGGK